MKGFPGRRSSLLRAVRDARGALLVTMDGCSTSERGDGFFDAASPAGAYALRLGDAYDRTVARELLRIATRRDGCRSG